MASSTSERPDAGRLRPGVLAAIGVATALVALLALDARATSGARVTADEPQYLTTALSLAEDLDLDIADELADERFRPYHEIPLDPQTLDLDGRGQRLSPHDPLLPLLLAPAMGLVGWVGAKATLAVLAGLTATVTAWTANRRLGVGAMTTTVVTLALFTTPPLTVYGTQVYPEMPAALAVITGVAALLGPDDALAPGATRRRWLVVAAVVALPWLSVKYVPAAAVLALGLVAPGRRAGRRSPALAVGVVLALGAVVYLVVHRRIYGGWTVYAAGDHFVGGEFEVVGTDPDYPARTRRLLGLLVDRRFGLVPWSPVYLLLVPAAAALARRPAWPRALLGGLVAAGWAVATWVALTMHGWWWPGRQVVVVLPVAALLIAGVVEGRPRLRAASLAAGALGLATWLWLVVEASTGRRTLIVDFFETSAPTYRLWAPLFPDHMTPATGDAVLTGLWSLVAIAGAAWGWRLGAGVDRGRADNDTTGEHDTAADHDTDGPDRAADQPAAPSTNRVDPTESTEPAGAER